MKEPAPRCVFTAGSIGVDAHQVSRTHLTRLETITQRERVLHARRACERLADDRALPGRDALPEVDLGLAAEQ
jgi:hypothetical protein